MWTVPLPAAAAPELKALPALLRPGTALRYVALPLLLLVGAADYGASMLL